MILATKPKLEPWEGWVGPLVLLPFIPALLVGMVVAIVASGATAGFLLVWRWLNPTARVGG